MQASSSGVLISLRPADHPAAVAGRAAARRGATARGAGRGSTRRWRCTAPLGTSPASCDANSCHALVEVEVHGAVQVVGGQLQRGAGRPRAPGRRGAATRRRRARRRPAARSWRARSRPAARSRRWRRRRWCCRGARGRRCPGRASRARTRSRPLAVHPAEVGRRPGCGSAAPPPSAPPASAVQPEVALDVAADDRRPPSSGPTASTTVASDSLL